MLIKLLEKAGIVIVKIKPLIKKHELHYTFCTMIEYACQIKFKKNNVIISVKVQLQNNINIGVKSK